MADPRLAEVRLTANEYLVDRAIRHAAITERFKSGLTRRIVGFLNDQVIPDLLATLETRLNRIASRGFDAGPVTTQRFKDMIAAADQVVIEGSGEMGRLLRGELTQFSKSEAQWQISRMREAFQGTLPVEFDFVTPAPRMLASVVTSRPFQGKFLRDEVADWSRATRALVRREIQTGVAAGEPVAQMVRRLRGTRAGGFADGVLQTARHNAERIARTAVNHVSAHARQAVFEQNDDLIKGVQWVATLDSRTSQICASLDGQVFGVRSGLRPPAHPNCRSTVVPVLKSFKELGIPGLKNVGTGQRHAREILSGKVPETMTFGQWWKRLPRGKQDEIFGPGKAKLLRSGKITFGQLIDQRGRPLTLVQLEDLAGRVAA